MKKYFTLAISVLTFIPITFFSQVGIGSPSPDQSALLDISSANKGLLIPRVALTSPTDALTIPNPATSLIVYNSNTSFGSLGLYMNAGTPASPNWRALQMQAQGGPIIEFSNITTATASTNISSLTNNATNWTEITSLRHSFNASAGARINATLGGMVEAWSNAAGAYQCDYLIKITQNAPIITDLPMASNPRNGVLIINTTNVTSPGIFASGAVNYAFNTTAPFTGTYYVQVYIARSNTTTAPANAWNAVNWSVNLLVLK